MAEISKPQVVNTFRCMSDQLESCSDERQAEKGGQHMFRLLYLLAALTIVLTILISSSRDRESGPDYQAYTKQDVIKKSKVAE